MECGGNRNSFGKATLIEVCKFGIRLIHHQDQAEWSGVDVLNVSVELRKGVEFGGIAHDHYLPRLQILGAAGPARDGEDVAQGGIGDGCG